MEFTCRTTCNQKALTAVARAVRKTVGAKRNRMFRLYVYIVIGLLLVALWISWGNVWQTVLHCVTITALLLLNWKEDAFNGYLARRSALSDTYLADITFYPDHYLTKTAATESKWPYEKILALAETQNYLVFVLGKNHALPIEKATLEGGSISEFYRFIEEKSGRKIQSIGG